MKILHRINWTNTIFLVITHTVAILGTILIGILGHFHWQTWLLALIFTIAIGLSVTAGYHRLFSHTSYKAVWPIRLLFLLLGAGAFEGSALEWCTDHRRHHRYTDSDQDPYSIKKGFWYAHMGWLFVLDTSKRDFINVDDLTADPLVRFQHRFFVPIAAIMGFLLPLAIACLWGDPWGGLIIAGVLRLVVNMQMTFCINSVCHWFGKRTYSDEQTAVDNWITALFTFGEGFHNFHHQFALDYRNGVRLYDFDPTKWLIRGLSFVGLTKDLKKVSKEQIIRYRIRSEENKIIAETKQSSESLIQYANNFVQPLRDSILQMAAQIHQLEKDCVALKKQKVAEYRVHLAAQRERLKQARQELKSSLIIWAQLVREHSKRKASYLTT